MLRKSIKYVHSDYLLQHADRNPAVRNRASLVHELITAYGLFNHMQLLEPKDCNPVDLHAFHSPEYLQKLVLFGLEKQKELAEAAKTTPSDYEYDYFDENANPDFEKVKYGFDYNCRIWSTMHQYACCIAGATMTACDELCRSAAPSEEVIINWTGGWNHAQRSKASGYCYVNDVVMGILVLLKRYQRVLYIDLDVHHGEAVQRAFDTTKRVFTLSFHRFEYSFYPGTGTVDECGSGNGIGYTANFPYSKGIRGENFCKYFKRVTQKILWRFQPEACVIQCGADCIVNDPMGCTNLTPRDLIDCIGFVMQQHLPTVLLGGGGFNFANTSRYWTSLTAALCGKCLADKIPRHTIKYWAYCPDYCLKIETMQLRDLNTVDSLEKCAVTIEENLHNYNVMPN